MLSLLKKLCTLHGISGREEQVRDFIREECASYASSITEDTLGNLLVFVKGKKRRKNPLMLAAHMDEVGIYIRGANDDGSLSFAFAGGVDRRVVIGKRILIGKREIPGIIGLRAVHLTTKEERKKTPKLSELSIDIGCESRAKAEKLVSPGEYAVFDSPPVTFGKSRLKSRAIDDRFGCAVLLSLMREKLMYDTWFVFTVQEEVGCRGANTATYSVAPHTALVIESTTAADIPSSEGAARVCELGRGAVIGCMDKSTIYDKRLFSLLRDIANKNEIPWQVKTRIAGGTDAGSIHISRDGVHTASLSLPTRYIHSPSCVADTRDMESVLNLAREFINCEEATLDD